MERARALRNETALNSITPDRAGGIMYDTLAYINEMQLQNANPLLISKIYDSVADMEDDSAPVSDLDGSNLMPGQLVCIVTGDPDDPEDGLVYRYDGTEGGTSSWTAVGRIGSDPYLEGYQYMGKAVLSPTPTDPGAPTQKVFYDATEPGTYGNFGGLVVNTGEAVRFKWDGTGWTKEVTGIAPADSTALNRLFYIGKGSSYSGTQYHLPLIKGHIYRIDLTDEIDLTGITAGATYVLSLEYMPVGGSTYTPIFAVRGSNYSSNLRSVYFECAIDVAEVDHFVFGGRAAAGAVVAASLADVTDDFNADDTRWPRKFTQTDRPLFAGRIVRNFYGNDDAAGTIYSIIYKVNDLVHINAALPDGYKMMTAIHPDFMSAMRNTSGATRHAFGCGNAVDANQYSQYRFGDSDYKGGYLMIRMVKNDESAISDAELAELKAGLQFEFWPLGSAGETLRQGRRIASYDDAPLHNDDFEFVPTLAGGSVLSSPVRAKYICQNISGNYHVSVNIDAALANIPTLRYAAQTSRNLYDALRSDAKDFVINGWTSVSQAGDMMDAEPVVLSVYFKKSNDAAFTSAELAQIKAGVTISVASNDVAGRHALHVYDVANSTVGIVAASNKLTVPYLGVRYHFRLPDGIKARVAYGTSNANITTYTSWKENGGQADVPTSGLCHILQFAKTDNSDVTAAYIKGLLESREILVTYDKLDADVVTRNYGAERYVKAALMRMNYVDNADVIANGGLHSMPVIAHISDLHGDARRFENFLEYIKTLGVDVAAVTGDTVLKLATDGSTYLRDAINGLGGHSILHCIGNHESWDVPSAAADRNAWLFEHHISPFADGYKATASADTTMPYYYKDFADKALRVIVLNQYDNGCYWGEGLGGRLGQTQVTWLCNTLLSTPAGYGVVVMMHSPETKIVTPQDMMAWNQTINYDGTNEDETGYAVNGLYCASSRPIRTIIDAFISNSHLVTSYDENTRDYNNGETVSIDADFTQLADGVEFVCYITGHRHRDNVGYVDGATNRQLVINVVCGNCHYPRVTTLSDSEGCDIPRGDRGATQDAFNVYAIDRKAGNVKLARVGSYINFEGIERRLLIAPYRE